jgi:hypothetical protein
VNTVFCLAHLNRKGAKSVTKLQKYFSVTQNSFDYFFLSEPWLENLVQNVGNYSMN